MRFSASFAAVATVIGLSEAMPADPPAPAATTVPYYYFKTVAQSSDKAAYSNLYLNAHHTGAGTYDATFSKGTPLPAHLGWFSGSVLKWFEPLPGKIVMSVDYQIRTSDYAAWAPVTMSGDAGTPGFKLVKEKLVIDNPQFEAWLVCDWHHSYPQLFTLIKTIYPVVIPSSCAKVDLIAESATKSTKIPVVVGPPPATPSP
ncbi:hypothetical protein E6O75_ATG03333 [Venturia nashicola]|uniref:DUF7907 domain-containing protein n=1 Tax=Venturia nashicola TaxID=86259 RepID=A0A4Z1P4H0_9PEZI|nr:hypothetical protein E6O75_ATG03333 [Venturia nashicola]